MKITHLYHSGCLVELKQHLLLFDYYKGELHLNQKKPLYIFVSHSHKDHFNQNILEINHPHKTYIFSSSIKNTKKKYTLFRNKSNIYNKRFNNPNIIIY